MDSSAIDALINNPPSTSTSSPSNPSHISAILSNWPNIPSILPAHIPHDLTPLLLSALAGLSAFTVDQPERAWNLLNTYYQCRIREGGKKGGLSLDIADVNKAIYSARRMSVGHDMESSSSVNNGRKYSIRDEVQVVTGKRKWSIKDEIAKNKQQKLEEEEEEELISLPPPLHSAFLDDAAISPKFPQCQLLPPIVEVAKRPLTIDIPPKPVVASIGAAQAATHEANLCQRELEAAEDNLNAARSRYADAQRKYGEAKRLVKRLRIGC